MTEYEKQFLEKFDKGEKFTEEELGNYVLNYLEKVDEKVDEKDASAGLWKRSTYSYFHVGDRYFEVFWKKPIKPTATDQHMFRLLGIDSTIPCEFDDQPTEVIYTEKATIKTIKEWKKIE